MKNALTGLCLMAIAVVGMPPADVLAQTATPIPGGRITRTLDVATSFDDFEIYLPNDLTEISVYAQWTNSAVVMVDDITFLCLYGPDGTYGAEDDDVRMSHSRQTSYTTTQGRFWHTTTVSGQRCWLSLDFQHHEQYDQSAEARVTIILSTREATEGSWPDATLEDFHFFDQKRAQRRSTVD